MTGRPSLYRSAYAEQARKLCAILGATDDELASFFGTCRRTVINWRKGHREFREAVRAGKLIADANVAAALYARAVGYSHPAVKFFAHGGELIAVPYVRHYAPDPLACIFWLTNRKPDAWARSPNKQRGNNGRDAPALTLIALPKKGCAEQLPT